MTFDYIIKEANIVKGDKIQWKVLVHTDIKKFGMMEVIKKRSLRKNWQWSGEKLKDCGAMEVKKALQKYRKPVKEVSYSWNWIEKWN